ncbi:helix-turn-helix domain-containing protein [Cohnella silvisoli]|uniref:Response regulator n=1 Tax=Cohnella silvisoli TaxID=2873699 RepID=A0ABV1KLR2_9BACL|nr:helix-turn-helix domain-containing protein [Cohnella silvisoli]MCD9020641.1 response regulator [Cohnella silvisoli]
MLLKIFNNFKQIYRKRVMIPVYKVLIAEDETLARMLLKNSIEWNRFDMQVVADVPNGKLALEAYEKAAPDIVITDIKMPIMDGMSFIASIRKRDTRTRIVILTCVEEFDLARQAMQYGVTDYLPKLTMSPVELQKVLGKVRMELDDMRHPSGEKPALIWDKEALKESLLMDFMFRGKFTEAEFGQGLRDLGQRFELGPMYVMVMEIDHYRRLNEKFKDEKGQLVRMSLLNVLDELLGAFGKGEAYRDADNRYILLLNVTAGDGAQDPTAKLMEEVRKTFLTYFKVTLTFGVSSLGHSFGEIRLMYEEACQSAANKFTEGLNRSFRFGALPDNDNINLNEFAGKWASLGSQATKTFLQQLSVLLGHDGNLRERVIHLFLAWLHRPAAHLGLVEVTYAELTAEYGDRIRGCETLFELAEEFGNYLNALVELRQLNSFSKEIAQALALIGSKYKDELTLRQIAKTIGISPNYLSTLFKKEVRLNFMDYLTNVRIEEAKRLLQDSNKMVYEISEQVGFSDQSYFTRSFKKIVGLAPNEYRKQRSPESSEDKYDR